ncbi:MULTISPECIES: heat-inducible transcriptional repressor HrcA [Hornefia]|uniref:Heat-inducible transcription repressor HrcA n=2 Tax=Hornefia TaxID=2815774 RepID=A0A1Q9JH00_9FIRM|nr:MULTISPECIES: heat-inducible transcriptional repressor HrcA [Hornefia]MCI7413591.1 heat-inducible transcriptional repressor HrcA [Clostridiales bacterium]MDD7019060.1 heat-inducible transcriptional repressor HrcA [Hornefia butyriciproducens]MDY2990891.1 heat-inducible transcriptional repressor HrcA [Hornefia butyriciproducens]MDY5463692.1 heat-inducible transcriptional repressor HrcA [Hornefia butyriciproducens]MDY6211205.1 heat-inducible transcriptional repressor HrcA [Hornefia butyricipro
MELTERKLKILQAIINDYVQTAEPVGSRTLSRKLDMSVSPATIRNEMSDLEEMGYLTHPHTSAGRVPSDKAYRLYVNNMMGDFQISPQTRQFINETLKADIDEFDRTIQRAAELLSEITNLASFAVSPKKDEDKLKFVNLLPVDERTVILMIVAESGKISNTALKLRVPYTNEALDILARNITCNYRGRTITEVLTGNIIDDFRTDIEALSQLAGNIMPNFMRTLSDMLNVRLYLDGLSNIFDIPEYSDLTRAKNFVSLFDRKDEFAKKLLDRDDGMIVTIGTENGDDDLNDCSLITATYHVNGEMVGKIGVIGPTRMKYGEVTSIVKYLTENLNNTFRLEGGEGEEDGE